MIAHNIYFTDRNDPFSASRNPPNKSNCYMFTIRVFGDKEAEKTTEKRATKNQPDVCPTGSLFGF